LAFAFVGKKVAIVVVVLAGLVFGEWIVGGGMEEWRYELEPGTGVVDWE
jgi:hypothetical protein